MCLFKKKMFLKQDNAKSPQLPAKISGNGILNSRPIEDILKASAVLIRMLCGFDEFKKVVR